MGSCRGSSTYIEVKKQCSSTLQLNEAGRKTGETLRGKGAPDLRDHLTCLAISGVSRGTDPFIFIALPPATFKRHLA